MFEILLSDLFKGWLHDLRDAQGKASILRRIRSAGFGNLGDVEAVGDGVSELRIHTGPGYRVYFTRRGKSLILLLVGGDKVLAEEGHQARQGHGQIIEGIRHETSIFSIRRGGVSG